MADAANNDIIVPLACGLLAAVGFAAILLRFRNRSDVRDQTLNSDTPPGWVTSDSASPALPKEQSDIDKIAAEKVEIIPPHVLNHAQRLKDQGASPEEFFRMMSDAFRGSEGAMQQRIMQTVAEQVFSGQADKSGFSFSASVSTSTSGGMHETLNMDKETFAKVRDLQAQGMSLDHICSDINPEYKGWEPAHQARYRNMMQTVLAFSGIHVKDSA